MKIRQIPSTHSVVIVALLPLPIKDCNVHLKRLDEQRQTNREVLNEVLQRLLQHLTFKHNCSGVSGYHNVPCADGNFRHCKSVLAAWLADCLQYSDLRHLRRHVCFWCECPKNEIGDYVPPDKEHPRRDHNQYRMLSDANTKAANAKLSSRHVHGRFNLFRHIPCIVNDLPKPNLLYTIPIDMLDHLQKWIFHFMKTHKWLDRYNTIWLSVPGYQDLTPKNKFYDEISQWNGKEMKQMSRYLLGVVTQSLRGGSPSQRPIFNHVIECTRAILEFYMYARYQSHDDATLSYMEEALPQFHRVKDVVLLGRAGKQLKAIGNGLRTEHLKKRKVDEETNAENWTPSKKRGVMSAWRGYISHEIDISKQLDGDLDFPNIHLMSHWVEQIHRYGDVQQYSAKRHEQAHNTNLKDSRNTSITISTTCHR